MTASHVALAYLVASVLFILALKGLSHPETARRGNLFGIVGMLIAVLTTLALTQSIGLILAGIAIGGAIGAVVARRVQMTQMPELVAAMHSLVGMAAVLIAVAVVNNPSAFGIPDPMPRGNRLELFIGTFVGAFTFSGSVIAFGKLAGWASISGCSPAPRWCSRASTRSIWRLRSSWSASGWGSFSPGRTGNGCRSSS